MLRRYGKIMLFSSFLLFLLVACGSADATNGGSGNSSGSVTSSNQVAVRTVTPVIVQAKSVHGATGSGPIVVNSPTPVPGGNASSEQVVLKDRTLVINSVSKQNAANTSSSVITLVLTVKNTSNQSIMNKPGFFQLMGAEGDTFSYQSNSSDNFYGTMPAQSSRNGTIAFQIPKTAAYSLRLLYRCEVATETTLILLKV